MFFRSSSDYDSDVLLGAESEARRSPLTYQQVILFDKSVVQRAKRRYINEHLEVESDDSLDHFDVVSRISCSFWFLELKIYLPLNIQVPNEEFEELFRSHLKRKKLRKKIRANPEVSLLIFLSLEFVTLSFSYLLPVAREKRKSSCEKSVEKG